MIHGPAKLLTKLLIRGYQLLISPIMAGTCRYHPTCSEYALTAVERHGVARGGLMALGRLLRCHPWGGHGYDPVAESNPKQTDGQSRAAREGTPAHG